MLAPIGSRVRVPSIVATRAALGYNGAQLVAVILFLTNFVWIALNNVIAASIYQRAGGTAGTPGSPRGRSRRDRRAHRAGRSSRRRLCRPVCRSAARCVRNRLHPRMRPRHLAGPAGEVHGKRRRPWLRRRLRLPDVVAADVRRLLALYEVGAGGWRRRVCRARPDGAVVHPARPCRVHRGALIQSRARWFANSVSGGGAGSSSCWRP
jgi:hypothetical protein